MAPMAVWSETTQSLYYGNQTYINISKYVIKYFLNTNILKVN